MKYRRPEFILDPPEAELLELPHTKTYHVDQAEMLKAVIHLAGAALAERSVEDFEAMRADGTNINTVFKIFDDLAAETETRELLTMNIMVSSMVKFTEQSQ